MLYANAKKRQFIPTPGNNEAQAVSLRPILIYGTKLYLDILFCDDAGEPLEFSESDTFECAGDINFTHSDDLMFYSGPERCFLTEVPGVLRFEIYEHYRFQNESRGKGDPINHSFPSPPLSCRGNSPRYDIAGHLLCPWIRYGTG